MVTERFDWGNVRWTKRSNDFATEVVGPFLFLCLRQMAFLRATGETTAEIKHKNFVGCVEYRA